jgi:hypothetical protein
LTGSLRNTTLGFLNARAMPENSGSQDLNREP